MNRIPYVICLILIFVADPDVIMAQPTKIGGSVIDHKEIPLPGANIYLEGTYHGASSDQNGMFAFETMKTGYFTLVVDYIGFNSYKEEVQLMGNIINLKIILKESFDELKAVTIRAGAFEASETKKSVILKPLDIVTTAGALGDVPGALQTLPGATMVGESGRLFVRGGHSSETQTYIDGTLVHEPYTTSTPNTAVRGRFNPFMFSGTVFSTGGYSAEYGQALSSVLLLKTKGLQQEDQVDLSITSIGLGMAGTKFWGRGAIAAGFDYTNLTPYMKLAPQNLDWIHYPVSYNGSVSLRQKSGNDGLFRAYITYDRSQSTLNQKDPDFPGGVSRLAIENQYIYLNASWLGSLNDHWSLKLGASGTSNIDNNRLDFGKYKHSLRGTNLKLVLSNRIHEKVKLHFGSEFSHKNFAQENRIDAFNNFENLELNQQLISGFAETDIYLSNKFMVKFGGRYEYSISMNKQNVAPRISAAFKLDNHSQMSFAWGYFYQDPDSEYLFYQKHLDFEHARHIILNYQRITDDRTFRVELYYKKYNHLIKFGKSDMDQGVGFNNNGYGYAYGVDLFWRDRKSIPNGDYWISYSYLDTKRNYQDFPYEAVPSFASRHSLSVVYKHWIGTLRSQFGTTIKYASPRVYNDPNQTEFNSKRMPPYRSVNVNWSFLLRQHIIIYGAITNIFGFTQSYGYNYATIPDINGSYDSLPIVPAATRFYFMGCFITLTRKGESNQMNQLE